jgi:hypothetical protein
MRHQTRVALGGRWLQRPELWWLTLLVTVEAASLVGYLLLSNTGVESLRYLLYPFVWINVGVVGVVHVTPRPASRPTQAVAAGLVGGASVVAALSTLSVDLSTAVFVGSVLLLAFRPSLGGAS